MNLFLVSHFLGVISFAFVLLSAMAAKYGMLKLCCSEYLIAVCLRFSQRTNVRHEGIDSWHSKIHRVCRRIVINWILSTLFCVIFYRFRIRKDSVFGRTSNILGRLLGYENGMTSSRVNTALSAQSLSN